MDNPINWSILHRSSFIRIKFRTAKALPVGLFEEAFCRAGPLFSGDTAFVLDDGADEHMLRAAAITANYLGRASGRARDIKVFYRNDLSSGALDKYNTVVFTGRDGLPSLKEGGAAVSLSWAPQAKDRFLFTIAASGTEPLEKAALYIANYDISTFEKDKEVLPAKTLSGATAKTGSPAAAQGSFKEMGYPDITVSGVFSRRTSFSFTRPTNWKIEDGALRFVIQHSRFLIPETSGVTIEINGTPVASKKFDGNPDRPMEVTARIPKLMLENKYYFASANFFLDIGQKDCNHQFKDKAWAVIKNNSRLSLAHRYRALRDLSDFPSLLMKGDRLMPTTLAVPDKPDGEILSVAMTIFSNIGASVPYDPGIPVVRKASSAPEAFKNDNIIIVGRPADFPWYGEAGRDLSVGYDSRKGSYETPEDLPNVNFEGSYAVMQTSLSPWNKRCVVLAVSAGGRGYGFLGNILSDQAIYGRMSGDFVYASGRNKAVSYRLKSKAGKQLPDFLYAVIWFAAVAAFALAVIGAYLFALRRKRI
jgi:hypothetical protein